MTSATDMTIQHHIVPTLTSVQTNTKTNTKMVVTKTALTTDDVNYDDNSFHFNYV